MGIEYIENGLTAESLASFRNLAGWGNTSIAQAQKAVRNTSFSIAAFDGEKTVGVGRIIGDGAIIWYIQDVVVLPEYRGHGIGLGIMDKLIDYAMNNSVGESVVTIGLMSARGKEHFYEKFGFVTRPNENGGAGMVMSKRILSPDIPLK